MSLIHWVWLATKKNIGSIKIQKILEVCDTPEQAFQLKENELDKLSFLDYKEKNCLADKDFSKAYDICKKCEKKDISIITYNDIAYPKMLKYIYNPPVVLYKKGNLDLNSTICIAIVGSRKATEYGRNVAYNFSKHLSKLGIIIVSGLARGIDTYAHKGALDMNEKTLAVLGCGPDVLYPKENRELMDKIQSNGGIISEYEPGVSPNAKNFPVRNRIISGMSIGTLIVEAEKKSGSLITANFAIEQSREVFAVPGNINSRLSDGTNDLIKQGAKPVVNINDILDEIKMYYK